MNTEIKITCFAGLRKFFETQFEMELELPTSYASIIEKLKEQKPEAEEALNNCRIAVNEQFVQLSEQIGSGERIYLIPPSSGG